jgi:hypothetical protein
MRLVSAAKYAALQTLQQRTVRELEVVEKAAADRLATITRLRAELEQARDARPTSPLPQTPATPGDAELRRQLRLAQRTIHDLGQRLDDLQTSHIADTRELRELREGVAS